MYDFSKTQITDTERALLRKLRVWIVALAIACVTAGIGIGAMLSGRPAVAQNEAQIARAPEALSASFAEIAKRVEPAVVNIDTMTAAPEIAGSDEDEKNDQSASKPLLDMLRRNMRRPARGIGSGFIVDPRGYILTNQHVIEGATRITVRLQSGEEFRGRVIGADEETDIAVIKVDASRDLPTVKLGDSSSVEVGDWVLAIGSPFGLDQTVTAGIISTKERQTPFSTFQQFLQTDAAINRGNSGGPLVNMRGEVIGVNSQIATSTGDYNGIGFALPANEASFVYQQIASAGKVRRGYLGINLDSVKSQYASVYKLPEAKGAIVTNVMPDAQSPAAKAGIQAGDVIVEFNNQPITNAQDLISKVTATPVGQAVPVAFLRDANGKYERRMVNVTLGERPPLQPTTRSEEDDAAPSAKVIKPKETKPNAGAGLSLGITLQELTPQIATERKLTGVSGLLVRDVDPNGIIADAHPLPLLIEGDVIQRVNRVPVSTLSDFQRIVSALKPGDAVVLNVVRYDRRFDRLVQRVVQFTYQ
jgi:serine protease Do